MAYVQLAVPKSPKKKIKKSQAMLRAEAEHEAFLRKMGVSKSQLKKRTKPKPEVQIPAPIPSYSANVAPTSDKIPGACPKPTPNVYSGERKLLGIAAMHKSSLIPIWSKDEAKELARMRRG